MQIITALPRYSDGEINRALMHEIQRGFHKETVMEGIKTKEAEAYSHYLKGHKTVPGLGKAVACIPERQYYRMLAKYGHKTVHSREFLRDFNRLFPELSPHRA